MSAPAPRRIAPLSVLTVLALAAIVVPFAAPARASVQATYYVSPTGSDSNPGTLAAPLQTLDKVRQVVAGVNSSMTGDIVVNFRGGDYPFAAPVTFGATDSGTNGHTIYYQAYSGETPVFDGGVPVTGWTQVSGNIYSASLSRGTKLRSLYVNGQRATVARGPVITPQGGYGTNRVTGGSASWAVSSGTTEAGIEFSTSDLAASYTNPGDLELVNQVGFAFHVIGLSGVSTNGGYRIANLQQPIGAIALSEPQPWGMAFYQRNNSPANQFYLQNAYELLDSPGEFYFNNATDTLYYDKRSTDDMSTAIVDAPTAEGLIDISGSTTTNRANHIAFTGITFGYTHWSLMNVAGSVGATMVQGNDLYDKYVADGDMHKAKYTNADLMPSAVEVSNASNITFSGDTFTHLGAGGITYGNDTINSTIVGNAFTDISGSAVTIGDPRNTYIGDGDIPVAQEGAPTDDTVQNNFIDHPGAEFLECPGIIAYYTLRMDISDNIVADAPYTGISLGWGWSVYAGYDTTYGYPASHVAGNNTVTHNAIYNVMQQMHDGGGIYTLGLQPGTKVTDNYLYNVGRDSDPGAAIYTDQGSTGIEIARNVVEDFHNGNWWNVWGAFAYVEQINAHDNVADYLRGDEGQWAIGSTNVHNTTTWSAVADATVANAGVQAGYRSIVPASFHSGAYLRGAVEAESGTLQAGASLGNDSNASGGKAVIQLDTAGNGVSFANVATATAVTVHYAAPAGGHISMYLNATKVGTVTFGSTGGWSTYSDVTIPVGIPEGFTFKIQNDSGDTGLNLDYLTFTRQQSSFVEAESGTMSGRADVVPDSAAYNGQVAQQLDQVGDGVSFANLAATSRLTIRYASPNTGHLSVYVNGVKAGTVSFASTGSWFGTYDTAQMAVTVPAGGTLKIQNDTGDSGINLDALQLSRIEAENGLLYSTGTAISSGDVAHASGGLIVANLAAPGRAITFTKVPATSQLVIAYASASAGTVSLYVNGVKAFPPPGTDTFSFTTTGAWIGSYATATFAVTIPQDANLTIAFDTGDSGINLDYLDLQ